MQKIEFYWSTNKKTGQQVLQLLDIQVMILATLDQRDLKSIKGNGGDFNEVVAYCNKYKGTSIGEFTPTVF